mgnify:CR=1 FL=1
MTENKYAIKEILLIDTPKEFPQSGFQWSINYIKKDYIGGTAIGRVYN